MRPAPLTIAFLYLMATGAIALAQDAAETPIEATPTAPTGNQTVLGPGMYVFQSRTRSATCGDDEQTGYVDTFMAPVHGVPGNREMRMTLSNSPYWSSWTMIVDEQNRIFGDSFMNGSSGANRPTNHFVVTRNGPRFTGRGVRSYMAMVNGTATRCEVYYDALLRRIDL